MAESLNKKVTGKDNAIQYTHVWFSPIKKP